MGNKTLMSITFREGYAYQYEVSLCLDKESKDVVGVAADILQDLLFLRPGHNLHIIVDCSHKHPVERHQLINRTTSRLRVDQLEGIICVQCKCVEKSIRSMKYQASCNREVA